MRAPGVMGRRLSADSYPQFQFRRHCEARPGQSLFAIGPFGFDRNAIERVVSDEAIQYASATGLLRFARNDDEG